jgi:hypothetical protein
MNKTPLNSKFDGLMQNRKMNLVLLIILGLFILVGIFILISRPGTNHPPAVKSLSQALTMVAAASRTAQVGAGPGSPFSSFAHATLTAHALSFRAALTATGNRSIAATADPDGTAQNNSQAATATFKPGYATDLPTDAFQGASPTFPVMNATVRPTYTPRPTSTSYPTARPRPTYTSLPTPGPGLPGLTMSSVIGQLKDEKGFSCAEADSDKNPVLWMCDVFIGNDVWYHVDLYGTAQVEITDLVVSVFQSNPDETRTLDILDVLASLPYDGSNGAQARQWVADTLPGIQSVNDVRDIFIGSVHYRLFGSPQGRYLEMGEPSAH